MDYERDKNYVQNWLTTAILLGVPLAFGTLYFGEQLGSIIDRFPGLLELPKVYA
jgi:hypothetical protein